MAYGKLVQNHATAHDAKAQMSDPRHVVVSSLCPATPPIFVGCVWDCRLIAKCHLILSNVKFCSARQGAVMKGHPHAVLRVSRR